MQIIKAHGKCGKIARRNSFKASSDREKGGKTDTGRFDAKEIVTQTPYGKPC
jgi:hypothetical protein